MAAIKDGRTLKGEFNLLCRLALLIRRQHKDIVALYNEEDMTPNADN